VLIAGEGRYRAISNPVLFLKEFLVIRFMTSPGISLPQISDRKKLSSLKIPNYTERQN